MKKRLVIVGLLLAVAVVTAVVVKREFFPAPGVTVQNFKRLNARMTLEEVEAILGQTGEDHDRWHPALENIGYMGPGKRWVCQDCVIEIIIASFPPGGAWVAAYGSCTLSDGTQFELAAYSKPLLERV